MAGLVRAVVVGVFIIMVAYEVMKYVADNDNKYHLTKRVEMRKYNED